MKNLTGRPILATLLPPQNHQNQQQQKFNNFSNSHSRSRGVNKISFRTPMLHGNRFFFDSHAAWECEFQLLRHLCSENAIIFIFATRPQRECQKSWRWGFRTIASASRRQRRGVQIATKCASCPDTFFFDRILCYAKIWECVQKLLIFPTIFNKYRNVAY